MTYRAPVKDMLFVMKELADIDAVAPKLLALREDIVTNSAPANGKSICDAGDQ